MNDNGIVTRTSCYGFDETVSRLTAMIGAKGAKIFADFDHSGEAAAIGLAMRPTRVLVFGSPAAGTPLMVSTPTLAVDLPLKILVMQNEDDSVSMVFTTASVLAARHGLDPSHAAVLGAPDALTAALARE